LQFTFCVDQFTAHALSSHPPVFGLGGQVEYKKTC
jgi:hypothetical protein